MPLRKAVSQSRAGPADIICVIQQSFAELVRISLVAGEMKQQTERQPHLSNLIPRRGVVGLLSATDLRNLLRNQCCGEQLLAALFEGCVRVRVRCQHVAHPAQGGSVIKEPWTVLAPGSNWLGD